MFSPKRKSMKVSLCTPYIFSVLNGLQMHSAHNMKVYLFQNDAKLFLSFTKIPLHGLGNAKKASKQM